MATQAELDELSSKELHDRAVRHAAKHLDLKFFWRLIEALPAAEAATGNVGEAQQDVSWALAHVNDLTDAGHGETADALRPIYIDYLADDSPSGEE
jgi:hypothetical protein